MKIDDVADRHPTLARMVERATTKDLIEAGKVAKKALEDAAANHPNPVVAALIRQLGRRERVQ